MENSDDKALRNNICIVCGKQFKSVSKRKYCSLECKSHQKERNKHTIVCKNCGKEAQAYQNAKFCSNECRIYYKNRQAALRKQSKRNRELQGVENTDYVVCRICGMKALQLGDAHFRVFHNSSLSKYKKLYPDAKITSQQYIIKNLEGVNNPGSTENTTVQERMEKSPFSKRFYEKRNLDLSKRDELYDTISKRRISNTNINFYLNKGYSLIDAKILLTERQRTNKYGSCSKECDAFIDNLFSYITDSVNFLYGKNEFKLLNPVTGRYCFYDFTDTCRKRIIEFNGDFWHVNENKCDRNLDEIHPIIKKPYREILEYDKEKYNLALQNGFRVLVVWESEYKKDPEKTIKKCLDFLKNT